MRALRDLGIATAAFVLAIKAGVILGYLIWRRDVRRSH